MVDKRSVSSGEGSQQRATTACSSCRLRKVKCNAQSVPPGQGCTPCQRAGQECVFDPLSDGRRSVNGKVVDKLQQRIEMLEALNQSSVDVNGFGINDSLVGRTGNVRGRRPNQSINSQRLHDIQSQSIEGNEAFTSSLITNSHNPDQLQPESNASSTNCSKESRADSPSFYGATSHPHVVSPKADSRFTVSDDGDDALSIALDANSGQLQSQLFRNFFQYQTLWVDIVDKETFLLHQKDGQESRWFSKFLEHAMLACSTRLSTSKSVRALGTKYCDWAKAQAMQAMTEPTPANLQGFLLLSEYEVTHGNDRPGWMFCGIACRMLSDLGLHEVAGLNGSSTKIEDRTRDSNLATGLLSACVVYEGVWTLYLGRPSSIPSPVMNTAASRCRDEQNVRSSWLTAWVGLCIPMAQVSHMLNDHSVSDLERSESLRKLLRQVESWYESLPRHLAFEEAELTNMDMAGFGFHTQYCKVQILLRQALSKYERTRKRQFSQISYDIGLISPLEGSETVIYQFSLRIARLVVTFREVFGTEMVPSIMLDNAIVAATTMIRHINKVNDFDAMRHDIDWLRHLIKSMELVKPHFPIIGRMLSSLDHICGTGQLGRILQLRRWSVAEHPSSGSPVPCQTVDAESPCSDTEASTTLGLNPVLDWDVFDPDFNPDFFFADRFGEAVHNIISSEPMVSNLAQTMS